MDTEINNINQYTQKIIMKFNCKNAQNMWQELYKMIYWTK